MPRINVDFWNTVHDTTGEPFDFLTFMCPLGNLPVVKRLVDRGEEYSDFLETPHLLNGGQLFGEASRGRKTNIPGKLNVHTGARGDLGVRADEAIEESIFFLYDSHLRVLATQRQIIFRVSTLIDLLRDIGNAHFHVQPILRKDKWNRVQRMESIGKVEIALQFPDHHPDFSGTLPSLNRLMDEAGETMNAVTAELTLSMKRSRQSLNVPMVKRLIDRLRREDNLDKLKVSGKSNDERSETVDFIHDKLVFSDEAEYQGRRVSADQCKRILQRAIEQHRQYLTSLL